MLHKKLRINFSSHVGEFEFHAVNLKEGNVYCNFPIPILNMIVQTFVLRARVCVYVGGGRQNIEI